jgi:cysteinyl-tRNA synthetase
MKENLKISFFDSLSGKNLFFEPLSLEKIGMYVCGPTVYDTPHVGNARSFVFYDLVFRVLKSEYKNVTYVRNITDVDDKIIAKATEKNLPISTITSESIRNFNISSGYLNCLDPTFEPKATDNISEMIEIISTLIERDFAYVKNKHVLFRSSKYDEYCKLSKKNHQDLIAGARIEIADYKENPEDFVLWKPAKNEAGENGSTFGFESPFGFGLPGWHIECSAMSRKYLGYDFDIHGGGSDLKFPHHDNEIAQSVCSGSNVFAKYWIHNGFVTVNGEKMSKSLGNFTTVIDLIKQGFNGEAIRLALLSTLYSKPLDFNHKIILDASITIQKIAKILEPYDLKETNIPENAKQAIYTNFNVPKYMAIMHSLSHDLKYDRDKSSQKALANQIYTMMRFIGLFENGISEHLKNDEADISTEVLELAKLRASMKKDKKFQESDDIRKKILDLGYEIEDMQNFEFRLVKIKLDNSKI